MSLASPKINFLSLKKRKKAQFMCVYVVNLRCVVLVCVLTLVLSASVLSRMSGLQVVSLKC